MGKKGKVLSKFKKFRKGFSKSLGSSPLVRAAQGKHTKGYI